MGSGTMAAMSVLESRWVPDMSEEDAKQLVRDAIRAGIFNDMGSGSYVDLVVIKPKDDVQYLRHLMKLMLRASGRKSTHISQAQHQFLQTKFAKFRLVTRTMHLLWILR